LEDGHGQLPSAKSDVRIKNVRTHPCKLTCLKLAIFLVIVIIYDMPNARLSELINAHEIPAMNTNKTSPNTKAERGPHHARNASWQRTFIVYQ
jgi:hypothetical protein